jgi:uncharacterized membrane protein
LGLLGYAAPKGLGKLSWPHFFPMKLGIIVCVIGFVGQYVIASGGIASPNESVRDSYYHKPHKFSSSRSKYHFFVGICLAIFMALAILSNIIRHKSVPISEIAMLFLAIYVVLDQYCRNRE